MVQYVDEEESVVVELLILLYVLVTQTNETKLLLEVVTMLSG